MKNSFLLSQFRKSLYSALVFFGTLLVLSVGYTAWNSTMEKVSSGSALSSSNWNALVDNISDLDSRWTRNGAAIVYTGGNVGIGIANPKGPLHIRPSDDYYAAGSFLLQDNTDTSVYSFINAHKALWIGYNENSANGFPQNDYKTRIFIKSDGNIGIGTVGPTEKLEVAGTIKATNINSNGSFVETVLNQCGGACSGDHGISTWINVGAYNYTWTTPFNTDTSIFTSNDHGVITVNKPGLYLVHESVMMIPKADMAYIASACPFINNIATCGNNSSSDATPHSFTPALHWKTERYDLYYQLNAGDTISYGYSTYWTMNNWWHDGYTSMRVTRIN